MHRIASTDNPLVKEILALHRRRRGDPQLLVEGRRAITDLIAAGWAPTHLLLTENLEMPLSWPEDRLVLVSERIAQRLSQAATASGYLAVFSQPAPVPIDPAAGGLILAGIADPGNLGTLVRSAAAFGLPQVVIVGGSDPYSAKAIAACAGAIARVAVIDVPDAGFPELFSRPDAAPACALVVTGGSDPEALEPKPRWLIVGSEAHGVPSDWLPHCAERLTLAMPGGTESLNAGVAGSIACYLLRHDRA